MQPIERKFSHLGFSISFYLIVSNILGFIGIFIASFITVFTDAFKAALQGNQFSASGVDPSTLLSSFQQFTYAMLPAYFIGIPVTILFLNLTRFRDVPELSAFSFQTEAEKSYHRKLSIKEFCMFFLLMFPAGTVGQFIGNAISALTKLIFGISIANSTISSIIIMKPWQILVSAVIIAPIFEELLYRYAVIGYCKRYGEWNAIIVSGLIFGLIHANIYQFFYALFLGMLFGYVYIYTNRIIYTIILHVLFNFFGSFVVALLPANDHSIPVIMYDVVKYGFAVAGFVIFIYLVVKEKLIKNSPYAPIQGLSSPKAYLNPGMISLILLSIALTVFSAFA